MARSILRSLFFSNSSSSRATLPSKPSSSSRVFSNFSGEDESVTYKRHLLCGPPPSLRKGTTFQNSCSLIGTVAGTVRRCDSKWGGIGAYAVLEVRHAHKPFEIMVSLWGHLAKVALKFLNPDDAIYVSGKVSSYEKPNASGKPETILKITASELKYVDLEGREPLAEKKTSEEEDEKEDRLRLWQFFFASPHEWWDNRKNKRNPRAPDFKHKNTNEVIWISPRDPPWVTRQLELFDQRNGRMDKSQARHASHFV